MKAEKYDKKLDELIGQAISRQRPTFDFDKWQKQHKKEIQDFTSSAGHLPQAGRPLEIWRIIMKSPITKLAAAAVIIIAVFLGLDFLGGPDLANTAWAEVTSHFAHVDYVHFYHLKSRDSSVEGHFEGWYAHGKMVIRGNWGGMTYDDGQTLQGFDKQGKRTVQRRSNFAEGQTFLEYISAGSLSHNNKQFDQQTPVNVGDDFLIYEFDPPADESKWLESIFITVGKNSLLPVQAKVYHKDGDYDLLIFDYEAPEKPAEFFESPAAELPHGVGEVVLDGEEVLINVEGAPGLKQAIVRLHSKYDGPSDQFPSDYMHSSHQEPEFYRAVGNKVRKTYKKEGGPIFRLDVSFMTDEGYRSNINDMIVLHLNEARQCGVGKDWPDGKYRNIRFSPLLKPTDREDTYIVEMRCWFRTEDKEN